MTKIKYGREKIGAKDVYIECNFLELDNDVAKLSLWSH